MSKYIDADASRDEFMEAVYDILAEDNTNNRANEIIDVFDTLPAADVEPVKKWILCSYILPEYGERVLAYWEQYGRKKDGIYGYIDIMHRNRTIWGDEWCCGEYGKPNGKVIAWQPLPKPPKMDGGDEKC